VFDLAALDRELTGSIFAGKLFFSSVVDSTNSKALAAARSGVPHGSVFFADEQTAGRGRGDHAWQSTAGEGLYVSVLLRPVFSSRLLPLLSLAVGLAAAEAIHDASGLTADLRWPNDLLLGPRKVGGMPSLESASTSMRTSSLPICPRFPLLSIWKPDSGFRGSCYLFPC